MVLRHRLFCFAYDFISNISRGPAAQFLISFKKWPRSNLVLPMREQEKRISNSCLQHPMSKFFCVQQITKYCFDSSNWELKTLMQCFIKHQRTCKNMFDLVASMKVGREISSLVIVSSWSLVEKFRIGSKWGGKTLHSSPNQRCIVLGQRSKNSVHMFCKGILWNGENFLTNNHNFSKK